MKIEKIDLANYLAFRDKDKSIPVELIFHEMFGCIPCCHSIDFSCYSFDLKGFLSVYKSILYSGWTNYFQDKSYDDRTSLVNINDVLVYIRSGDNNINLYFEVGKDISEIKEIIYSFMTKDNNKESVLNLVTKNMASFNTMRFVIKDVAFDESNYNDDFISVNRTIVDKLNNGNKGIVLLHGIPGTGKTSYIRYLCGAINKQMIYIPPDMAHIISDPGFIGFMSGNTNSVLVIEDAETILTKRTGGNNQSVSNLLNLSDGLLSDCFNVQIICTFNSNLRGIDDALLRKGRLICEYEFKALSPAKAALLALKLGVDFKQEATLADIYNSQEDLLVVEKKLVGFNMN